MGGFGLGGKAPLATMTPFYTTITCYNGMLFKLNIFADKAESLIGKFNEDTGDLNEFVTFKSGAVVYYEKSTSKNYTEIVVPVKKLNKQKYIDAVESQLLYLPGIKFFVEDAKGYRREIDFKAKILYESENIVISRNSQYSKPHLILVKDKESNYGVCYNEINYKELELEQRYGAVALKVQSKATTKDDDDNEIVLNDGVTVTPNREDIVWNDDTKKYLLAITKNVTNEATQIVQKQLTEEDFLKWLSKCSTVLSNISYGSVLHEIAKMIDKESIKPVYSKDSSIRFESVGKMFWGMTVRVISEETHYSKGKPSSISRTAVEHWSNVINRQVYLQADVSSVVKDRYLCSENGAFITIQVQDADALLDKLLEAAKNNSTTEEVLKDIESKFWDKVAKREKILQYITESADIKNYDLVEIPEDFRIKEEAVVAAEEANTLTLTSDYRKIQGLVVIQTPRDQTVGWHTELVWEVHEIKAVDLPTLASRIYYGFDEDKVKIKAACRVLGNSTGAWYNKDIAVIKVSRKLEKIISKHAEHVSKFFFNVSETNVITMSPEVIKYQTAAILEKRLTEKFEFLNNYTVINPEITGIYKHIKEYIKSYYTGSLRLRTTEDVEKELADVLIKCAEFQMFVRTADNSKSISDKAVELFGIAGLVDAETVDLTEIDRLALLDEYVSEINPLFNLIPVLTTEYRYTPDEISQEAIKLLEIIIKAKGLDQFEIPEKLRLEEKPIIKEELPF